VPTAPGTRARPNANYILAIMRDDDLSDPWGTGMSWAWAVCSNLDLMGEDVPAGLGYQPGAGGAVLESFEDEMVREYLLAVPQPGEPTAEERITEVQRAGVILDRYLDWCKAAGRDY
jgi:hypothetical protein